MNQRTYLAPQADYYEGTPDGFDVYSWSPAPAGTPIDRVKSTQVHLHGIVSFGRLCWRFKSNRSLDRLIAALLKHRMDVWQIPYERELADELRVVRDRALEDAALMFESVNPASDSERSTSTPGTDAMGAVIEFRDKIRSLKASQQST